MRSPIPAELSPESVVAVIDSREQLPFSAAELAPLQVVTGTLTTGDVSIRGLEHVVAIELKHSIADLVHCVGQDRERFDREIQRLLGYQTRAVVCECSWSDLERGDWRGKITATQATGSVLGWIGAGVPFLFCGTRQAAAKAVSRLLFITARRHWRIARSLVGSVATATKLSPNAYPPETIDSFCPAGEA
jgi:DNA excision repair protein ERCC-4